jgi:glutamate 5-kinase
MYMHNHAYWWPRGGCAIRLVVKLGSSSVVDSTGWPDARALWQFCMQVRQLLTMGHDVVVVSSGAVATGTALLGSTSRPRPVRAAVGQAHLIGLYRRFLGPRAVAQLLVLRHDLERGAAALRATLEALLAAGVLPIVNENDAVSRPETAIGENDQVAAQLAVLMAAHRLVLLSDVDGLYPPGGSDGDPPLPHLDWASCADWLASLDGNAVPSRSPWGRGGLGAKLQAALLAAGADVPTVVARGRSPRVLLDVVEGRPVGTWIGPAPPASWPREHRAPVPALGGEEAHGDAGS